MLGVRLVRLIEKHSEALARGLAEQIQKSDRTPAFRTIPIQELRLAATDVYSNLGEWLLRKTESDIARRFKTVGKQRSDQGIALEQFVWALMLTRDHLWHFLRREAFADNIVELHAELELQQLLSQFFDRAIYYAMIGYEEAHDLGSKGDLERARDLVVSIGLMSQ